MTNISQVKTKIIQPMLNMLPAVYNTQAAANLLAYTFLAESNGGEYIVQLNGGPAIGPFQMEPATHDDCWSNFLDFRSNLAAVGRHVACGSVPTPQQMAANWIYAAFMCRVKYIRAAAPLPAANDPFGIVTYWKTAYNSALGAGTIDQFHIDKANQAISA